MKLKEVRQHCKRYLQSIGIDEIEATSEAELIVFWGLGCTIHDIIMQGNKELSKLEEVEISNILEKRGQSIPIQYIFGKANFYGLELKINNNVLIPRWDTEILVEAILNKIYKDKKDYIKLLDIGTGSGAIGLAIANELDKGSVNYVIHTVDISKNALEVAKSNYKCYNKRVSLFNGNILDNSWSWELFYSNQEDNNISDYSYIISNPPYIKSNVIPSLSKEVKNEPILALDGGKDGLIFYKRIIENADKYLEKNGSLAFEIGYDQGIVKALMEEKGYRDVKLIKDLAKKDRVIIGSI